MILVTTLDVLILKLGTQHFLEEFKNVRHLENVTISQQRSTTMICVLVNKNHVLHLNMMVKTNLVVFFLNTVVKLAAIWALMELNINVQMA